MIFIIISTLFYLSYASLDFEQRRYDECIDCPDGYYGYYGFGYFTCLECGCDGCVKTSTWKNNSFEIVKYAGSCKIEGTCYPGFGMKRYSNECHKCSPGEYSTGGDNRCNPCPNNSYTNKTGSTECIKCPKYQISNYDKTACRQCKPGEYYDKKEKTCLLCPENTISTEYGQMKCKKCKRKEHSDQYRQRCLPGAPIQFDKLIFYTPVHFLENIDTEEFFKPSEELLEYQKYEELIWGKKTKKSKTDDNNLIFNY